MATLNKLPRYVAAVVLFLTIVSAAQAKYSGGMGEPNDPYQIATAEDLITLGETPDDYDKHFILTADIDLDPNLPGGKVFDKAVIAPVTDDTQFGLQGSQFTGVFDGSGHTISNLTIKGKEFLGLFGTLGWFARPVGEVKNLRLVDVNIAGSGRCVGGLVGHIYPGVVMHCSSSGTVRGDQYVGGLVGANDGNITACSSAGTVRGDQYVGGLVGYSRQGLVSQCRSASTVNGNSSVGGLVGLLLQSTIRQCYSCGLVSGVDGVGGVVGTYGGGHVARSFWDIETSDQTRSAGGTGKTTAEMQTASTFLEAGWDFVGETDNGTEDIWKIAEGLGYPRLSWEKYSGGTGEPNDPYQIATAADLIALGETPEDYDKHFILTADIDLDPNLPGQKVFVKAVIAPAAYGRNKGTIGMGVTGVPFTGSFNGNGHLIFHLTMAGEGCLGLFGYVVTGAEITSLGIHDVAITGTGMCIGGLVGLCDGGKVNHCHTTGVVHGSGFVGGLVGGTFYEGHVTQCYSNAAVSGSGGDVGGLVGSNGGVVAQCCSTGTVFGDGYVGGLVGSNGKSMVDGWGGEVIDCYSTGAVTGTGEYGGVGGLVGTNTGSSIIRRCYSTGTVAGNKDVGGLVGYSDWGTEGSSSSFWDIQTSGQVMSASGTGKTTLEMQNMQTYQEAGWDFAGEMQDGLHEIWQMTKGGGYPVLTAFGGYTPPELQGMGTEENPYLISNAIELGAMIHYSSFASYRLADSIDLSGIRWVTSVIPQFDGTFDGDGHTISNLTITGKDQVALFGQLRFGAEVRDVGVVDVNIVGSGDYVGGLVGRNMGTISQCYSSGSVSGGSSVGGLIGWNEYPGAANYCYSTGEVNGTYYVGGLAGRNFGSISSSYSVGGVSGTYNVGGLVGENPVVGMNSEGSWEGSITNCYSSGSVDGKYTVGGLVGSSCWGTGWGCIVVSFWDIQASGQTRSAGGTGKTTVEMQTAQTFLEAGWDFIGETANGTDDIWWILEGQDYPRLWWELPGDDSLVEVILDER